MKSKYSVLYVSIALILGFILGHKSCKDSTRVKSDKDFPSTNHAIEVYKEVSDTKPMIAETLLVLDNKDNSKSDRPLWRITYSNTEGKAITYYAQSVTKE